MVKMNEIYMDYNSTTPPTDEILDLTHKLQGRYWHNPNSIYKQGREARKLIDKAREQCANAIGADPEQILFTSCASESNAMVFAHRDEFIEMQNSPFEHTDIIVNEYTNTIPLKSWEDKNELNVDLFSLMLVNNESGRIFDVKNYTDYIHSGDCIVRNAKIHSDMSQAFGKIPIDVKDLDVDFATFSSQKIGSIRGCSVLYVKEPKTFKKFFEPLVYGHQEQGLRGGTENTTAIACMGLAMEKYNYDEVINDVWRQYKQIMTRAFSAIPGAVVLNTDTDTHKFTNNVVQVSFKGVESESLVLMCDSQGLCISGGAACNSGSLEPSNEVKYLCGLHDPDTVNPHGVVRISYGWGTMTHDIDQTIKIIKQAVTNLREINGNKGDG